MVLRSNFHWMLQETLILRHKKTAHQAVIWRYSGSTTGEPTIGLHFLAIGRGHFQKMPLTG